MMMIMMMMMKMMVMMPLINDFLQDVISTEISYIFCILKGCLGQDKIW